MTPPRNEQADPKCATCRHASSSHTLDRIFFSTTGEGGPMLRWKMVCGGNNPGYFEGPCHCLSFRLSAEDADKMKSHGEVKP